MINEMMPIAQNFLPKQKDTSNQLEFCIKGEAETVYDTIRLLLGKE